MLATRPLTFNRTLGGSGHEALREEIAAIYSVRHQQVLRAVAAYTRDLGTAEEVMQEAFFRLYRHCLSGGAVENVLAWTLAVARNLARDRARERKREDVVSQQEWHALFETHADSSEFGERPFLDREERNRLLLLIELLPEPQRNCVKMYGQGFSFKEIAASIGLPYHQVLLQTRNGLSRVKRLLLR